jgi:hypothetical protein
MADILEHLVNSIYGKQPTQVSEQAPADLSYAAPLNFDMTTSDAQLIAKIVARGVDMAREAGTMFDQTTAAMDLCAAHCNGTPLKLLQLLMSCQDDFSHDFCGIGLHLDRRTGQFKHGFYPRFAVTKH